MRQFCADSCALCQPPCATYVKLRSLQIDYRLVLWQTASGTVLGWTRAGERRGAEELRACIANIREVMPGVLVPFLRALADAQEFVGDYDAQLLTIKQALYTARRIGEHCYEADLYGSRARVWRALAGTSRPCWPFSGSAAYRERAGRARCRHAPRNNAPTCLRSGRTLCASAWRSCS